MDTLTIIPRELNWYWALDDSRVPRFSPTICIDWSSVGALLERKKMLVNILGKRIVGQVSEHIA